MADNETYDKLRIEVFAHRRKLGKLYTKLNEVDDEITILEAEKLGIEKTIEISKGILKVSEERFEEEELKVFGD